MTAPVWTPALLGTVVDGGRLRCDLCPHLCELAPGEVGECAVRRNNDGALETATFAASVRHDDAIERKPFYHVLPGSRVHTLGAPGCSFRCNYCINHRLSQYGRTPDVPWTASPVDVAAVVDGAAAAGASIGLSYAEPGLAPELTLALAERAAPLGVPILWKSNGFLTPPAIDLVAPHLFAVNIDVKAPDDRSHARLTGAPVGPVLDAIERFRAAGVWVEVCTPLIPGVSDTAAAQAAIARRIAAIDPEIPWHLLRFTPDFRMRRHPPTQPADLLAAATIGYENELAFVYVERALGADYRNSRCRECGSVLIERGIWSTITSSVADGRCAFCDASVPGRWVAPGVRR
jgi:pyruvate formate lyase activating enzyme